jgi:hypothetical protein
MTAEKIEWRQRKARRNAATSWILAIDRVISGTDRAQSERARRSPGHARSAVRFYVDKGLLEPARSAKGDANPYPLFTQDDVTAAQMIRLQQSPGCLLAQIRALGRISPWRGTAATHR